jgi:FkbM family methyltransferase
MKSYRNYRQRLLVGKILRNWNLTYHHRLNTEDCAIIREIFYDKTYSVFFPFYKKCTIVDIGGHKGFFALYAANNCAPDSTILCFEPSTSNYRILRDNLRHNGIEMVTAVNKAILSRDGETQLHLYGPANNSVCMQYGNVIDKKSTSSENVQSITLGGVFETFKIDVIDFLKMDCEGAEYEILFNCDRAVLKRIKVLSFEFHDLHTADNSGYAIARYLRKQGFAIVEFSYHKSISRIHCGHITAINEFQDD